MLPSQQISGWLNSLLRTRASRPVVSWQWMKAASSISSSYCRSIADTMGSLSVALILAQQYSINHSWLLFIKTVLSHRAQPFIVFYLSSTLAVFPYGFNCPLQDFRHMSSPTKLLYTRWHCNWLYKELSFFCLVPQSMRVGARVLEIMCYLFLVSAASVVACPTALFHTCFLQPWLSPLCLNLHLKST